jgi:hypothetical protein
MLETEFSVRSVQRLYHEDQWNEPVSLEKSRVVSLQLAFGGQTRRRPPPSGGAVGGKEAPTLVSRRVLTPN